MALTFTILAETLLIFLCLFVTLLLGLIVNFLPAFNSISDASEFFDDIPNWNVS